MLKIIPFIFQRLGEFRTDVIWRFFGFIIIQVGFIIIAQLKQPALFLSELPASSLLLYSSGMCALFFGCNLFTLIFVSLSAYFDIIPVLFTGADHQIGEEFQLFLTLPVMLLISTLFLLNHRKKQDFSQICEDTFIVLCRITCCFLLFFVVLHKCNADFIDPHFSCFYRVIDGFNEYWHIPFGTYLYHFPPGVVLVLEGAALLLILLFPRLGIIWIALLFGSIGHSRAQAIALCIIAVSFSFLERTDKDVLFEIFKKTWKKLVCVLVTASFVSYFAYKGSYWGIQYLFYHLAWVTMLWMSVLFALKNPFRRGVLLPKVANKPVCVLIGVYAMMLFLNGLTPYFGLKFRLSYAMFSNLRVDHNRWNSFVMPKFMYLRKYDPYLTVHHARLSEKDFSKLSHQADFLDITLHPGMFSLIEFHQRYHALKALDLRMDIDLSFKGDRMSFKDILHDKAFLIWLNRQPKSKMFQEVLQLDHKQHCLH